MNEIPDLTIEEALMFASAGKEIEINDGHIYVSDTVSEAM